MGLVITYIFMLVAPLMITHALHIVWPHTGDKWYGTGVRQLICCPISVMNLAEDWGDSFQYTYYFGFVLTHVFIPNKVDNSGSWYPVLCQAFGNVSYSCGWIPRQHCECSCWRWAADHKGGHILATVLIIDMLSMVFISLRHVNFDVSSVYHSISIPLQSSSSPSFIDNFF